MFLVLFLHFQFLHHIDPVILRLFDTGFVNVSVDVLILVMKEDLRPAVGTESRLPSFFKLQRRPAIRAFHGNQSDHTTPPLFVDLNSIYHS